MKLLIGTTVGVLECVGYPNAIEVVPYPQSTAPQQSVWKTSNDSYISISWWGSLIPASSTLSISTKIKDPRFFERGQSRDGLLRIWFRFAWACISANRGMQFSVLCMLWVSSFEQLSNETNPTKTWIYHDPWKMFGESRRIPYPLIAYQR